MADFYYCRRADCKCTKKRSPCYPESMARCGQCNICLHPISKGEPDWGDDSPVGSGVTTPASAIDAILGTVSSSPSSFQFETDNQPPQQETVVEKPVQEKVERKVAEKQPEKLPERPNSPRKPPIPQFNRVDSGRARMITSSITAATPKAPVPVVATKPLHTRAKSAGYALHSDKKDDIMGRDSVSLDNINWMFDRASTSDLPALQRLLHRGPLLANKVKQGAVYVAYEADGRFQSEPLGGTSGREVGGFITCEPDQFRPNTFVVGQIHPGKSKPEYLLRQLELQLEGERGVKTLLSLVASEDHSLQQVHLQAGFSPCGTLALTSGDLRVWYKKEVS